MEHERPDFLAEFHLHNPDEQAYALIAHLITVLEQQKHSADRETLLRNISNLLGDAQSMHILHIACQKLHVDYLSLIQECQKITVKHVSPRLLLHIICLPATYVSEQLQIDLYRVTELMNELSKNFTIDDPIAWLKRLLDISEKERLKYGNKKEDLLHGLAVVDQPVDTAEERKTRERRLWLRPRPPTEPE